MKRSDLNPVDGAVCEHNRYYYNQKKADSVMDEMEKRIKELEKEVDEVKMNCSYSVYLENQLEIQKLKDENSKLRLQSGVK